MSVAKIKTDVKIADDIINIIAGIAATSVDGVLSIGEGLTFTTIPFIGTKNLKQGIIVEKDDNDKLNISIIVALKSGIDVKKACYNIQEKIKESIESMLDMSVNKVVVKVAKIDDV